MIKKKCQLCLKQYEKLCRSHIIPKWAYPYAMPKKDTLQLQSGCFPKRKPIGEYDHEILCFDCEKKFNTYDSYGCSILRDTEAKTIPRTNNKLLFLAIKDHSLFLMFVLSVLWRMHASKLFPNVNLGFKHSEKIRYAILTNTPLKDIDYPLKLCRIIRDLGSSSIISSPVKKK